MRLTTVTDPADERLLDYTHLTDAALRSKTEPARGIFIAESSNVIARALEAGCRPLSALIQAKWRPDVERLFTAHPDLPVYEGSDELLEHLTGYRMHRGALAAFARPQQPALADVLSAAHLVVVVEDVVDHTNLGAIIRSCAALGADAVLVTRRCADPLYRRSIRVSMGTVFQLPWVRLGPWKEAAELLHAQHFQIAAMALSDHAVSLDSYEPGERTALMVGTEGDGLSHGALASADTIVTVPMSHGVDSLNVNAATAVGLWEITRHHRVGQ